MVFSGIDDLVKMFLVATLKGWTVRTQEELKKDRLPKVLSEEFPV